MSNTETTETKVVGKRGRPIEEKSARQLRLAAQDIRKSQGLYIGKGRPVNPMSARQIKLAERKAQTESRFVIKKGAPKKVQVPAEM
ncbi:MAG: hypothetical protein JSU03_05040 [Bacteroidetes bacterium]|nr:hypothetical protein [Bacteroidota bacterium]